MIYALIEDAVVTNVIEWDGESSWPSPDGVLAVEVGEGIEARIGDAYEGGAFVTPASQPSPVLVPDVVTMRQARLALLGIGKLTAVDDAIAGMASPQKEAAAIEWEFAGTVDRGSPIVAMLASALNLNEVELDELFTQAAGL